MPGQAIFPRPLGQTPTGDREAVIGAVVAPAWVAAVFVWPGLPGGAYGQSGGLIAVASIAAGLVVLALTVGSNALQVLADHPQRR